MERLADIDHPRVQQTAARLTRNATTDREKLERIFKFVRDDILFGFPPEGDFVKASQTIVRGYGQCNTKGNLFLALCRASEIPARIHYSLISKEIQHGFFLGLAYWFMPAKISHSWLEVEIDGQWHQLDTYINDRALHHASVRELERRGWTTGFSVSRAGGEPSADLVLDDAHYSQMGAVVDDLGTWDWPVDFLSSPANTNRVDPIRQWLYRQFLPSINRRIERLRQGELASGNHAAAVES